MKKKKIVKIAGIILAIALIVSGGVRAAANKNKGLSVRTSRVENKDLKSYLSTTGVIESAKSKDYYASQLKVTKINVKTGDKVKKGDVLVTFDTSDLNSAVKQAQISYNNAQLQYNELLSKKDTIDKNIKDLDNTISQLESNPATASSQALISAKQSRGQLTAVSDNQVKQAQNAVDLAKIQLDSTQNKVASTLGKITADFDGTVTALNLVEGAVANPGAAALTIMDLQSLKVSISLGKNDSEKVNVGSKAIIHSTEGDQEGTVSFLNPVAEKDSSNPLASGEVSLRGEITPSGEVKGLKVGFDVDVDILLGEKQGALSIPAEALKAGKGGKYYVYVDESGITKEKEVTVGLQTETDVEITSGLNASEEVILNPNESIVDGTKISVS
ncbi:MAG: efflux RND transporter periplasmic adaptor subunit [Clostridiaceae bacterium]